MKVSAIMPTRGRPELSAGAVLSFLSQTYEDKELIIYDDKDEPAFTEESIREFSQGGLIRAFEYSGERLTIAQKRNWLCSQARGEIIMHFDSDDWSAADRMTDQVERLQSSGLAVTGYHSMLFYHAELNRALKFKGYINTYALGTTLAYRRDWWADHPFPLTEMVQEQVRPLLIGEDNKFVTAARRAHPRQILSVDAGKHMVARIHKLNTCRKDLNGCSFATAALTDIPKEFFL